MVQNARILEYLKTHDHITQREAVSLFGIYRLSARIYDLRSLGHKISSTWATGRNRYGGICRFVEYRYEGEING